MGSFSNFYIGKYPIHDLKNSYYADYVTLLFDSSDYKEERRPENTRNQFFWGDAYVNSKKNFMFKGYSATVKICKERLEIHGASLSRAKKDFQSAKKIAREQGIYSFPFTSITYEKYLREIKYLVANNISGYDMLYINFRETLSGDGLYFYGQSTADYLYSVLQCFSDDDIVEYDLTDIINGGWVKKSDLHDDIEKIIVLTEGRTDTEFISKSLQLLYPYLFNHYKFFDFGEFNVKLEANASALVRMVITFATANTKHPIIALFDNDTTGIMELDKLKAESLPANIKAIKLPDLKLAKNYPTIGPTGIRKMNVNGLACGIEMYLGEDCLKRDGKLIPVQWKGYNDKVGKYQGEIVEKNRVQEAFRKELSTGNLGAAPEMHELLRSIFSAFT